jgi:IMP cyclohydrolase
MEKVLDGAGAEPDSYHTPRIAGIITGSSDKAPVLFVGIKAHNIPARATGVEPKAGTLYGVSTYKGSLDSPEARDPAAALSEFAFEGSTAEELASYLFEISLVSYKGNDIRVCAVGGIRSGSGNWELAINNVHNT